MKEQKIGGEAGYAYQALSDVKKMPSKDYLVDVNDDGSYFNLSVSDQQRKKEVKKDQALKYFESLRKEPFPFNYLSFPAIRCIDKLNTFLFICADRYLSLYLMTFGHYDFIFSSDEETLPYPLLKEKWFDPAGIVPAFSIFIYYLAYMFLCYRYKGVQVSTYSNECNSGCSQADIFVSGINFSFLNPFKCSLARSHIVLIACLKLIQFGIFEIFNQQWGGFRSSVMFLLYSMYITWSLRSCLLLVPLVSDCKAKITQETRLLFFECERFVRVDASLKDKCDIIKDIFRSYVQLIDKKLHDKMQGKMTASASATEMFVKLTKTYNIRCPLATQKYTLAMCELFSIDKADIKKLQRFGSLELDESFVDALKTRPYLFSMVYDQGNRSSDESYALCVCSHNLLVWMCVLYKNIGRWIHPITLNNLSQSEINSFSFVSNDSKQYPNLFKRLDLGSNIFTCESYCLPRDQTIESLLIFPRVRSFCFVSDMKRWHEKTGKTIDPSTNINMTISSYHAHRPAVLVQLQMLIECYKLFELTKGSAEQCQNITLEALEAIERKYLVDGEVTKPIMRTKPSSDNALMAKSGSSREKSESSPETSESTQRSRTQPLFWRAVQLAKKGMGSFREKQAESFSR